MTPGYDVAAVRRLFPAAERVLYLDAAHQAPLARPVHQAFTAFLEEGLAAAGPKSLWLSRIPAVREQVARLLGASAGEIAFTRNTSDGLNIAANALALAPGDRVLLVEGDHPNLTYAWLNLQRKGVEVRFVTPGPGGVAADAFAGEIDGRTRAIVLSHVTSDRGDRADLAAIGRMCRERGIALVVDAIQSIGTLEVDVAAMGVSVLATGCHKGLLVPQGLGILYVDQALGPLAPPFLAASAVTNPRRDGRASYTGTELRPDAARFEGGNLNLPHLHALAAALDLISGIGAARIEAHVRRLSDLLVGGLGDLGVGLLGPIHQPRRAHIVVIDLPATAWLPYLEAKGVRVSAQRGGIRVSFGMFNTDEDVREFLRVVEEGLSRFREV